MEQQRWYIIRCYSGFEKKVAQSIQEQAEDQSITNMFENILIPSEEVIEARGGKKVSSERRFFPGYILLKMKMTDRTWHLVRNTPKVTGFLGAGNKPMSVPDHEAERVMNQVQEGVERPRPAITFEIGETIRVADGPFSSFNGTVQEIDNERARLKVAVSIFGRPTPVELEYSQVEKI